MRTKRAQVLEGSKIPLNLSKLTAGLRGDGSTTIIQGLTINQYLWQASLSLLDAYPIKIVDSQGGFVSTEWITNSSSLIKDVILK